MPTNPEGMNTEPASPLNYLIRRTDAEIRAEGALFCYVREFNVSPEGIYKPSRRFVQVTGCSGEGRVLDRWSVELTITEERAEQIRSKLGWALSSVARPAEKQMAYVIQIPGELEIEFRTTKNPAGSITVSDAASGRKVTGTFATTDELRAAVSSVLRLGWVEQFNQ